MTSQGDDPLNAVFPEAVVGGFTRIDGTVEFFSRVNSLLLPDFRVLDFGAGRGEWLEDGRSPFRRQLRNLKGKVREVVGVDLDEAVLGNPSLDRALVIRADSKLPFEDGHFDIIVSDWTFEHVQDASGVAAELDRVLKPGGWICARTPNLYGYAAQLTRLIPNAQHATLLSRLQPTRQQRDVFPTHFRMNTLRRVGRLFPNCVNHSYTFTAEPAYAGRAKISWRILTILDRLLPRACGGALFIFLHKPSP